ncbi:MAG: diacylglycerol kinase family protein [Anaerolineae bacterium]|jgi:diacylglycerol kinase (ATP)|nr:diacylglycerol kinase family protein [Anaerolineae bacterium]MBT7075993.1 diacylglycerol kinase family protein [Anaerolineae bacterium]MBT7783732.1 diacylglycerol kinase family protein [Anaerolineae bacterium]
MSNFIKSRLQSFIYAFHGWNYVLRNEPNTWIHAVVSILVVLAAFWLHLPARDWAVLVLAIGMVWTAEFFNTALENIIDLASPEEHPLAKAGKDIAAASVLIAALASILIGLLILGPPLWEKLIP